MGRPPPQIWASVSPAPSKSPPMYWLLLQTMNSLCAYYLAVLATKVFNYVEYVFIGLFVFVCSSREC